MQDRGVEAVYNALPNALHHEWTIAALEAGKHVLCEKPFASNLAESEQMFDVAESQGRCLVEAFMYRSHPLTAAVIDQVRRGAIGDLKLIRLSFCFATRRIDDNVRFITALSGGALMDLGCYCTSFARLHAGTEPTEIHATAQLHESGVDILTAGTLRFGENLIVSFVCGMNAHADNSAYLCGSDGFIVVPIPWKPPVTGAQFTVASMTPPRMDRQRSAENPPPRTFRLDAGKPLYALEADDFAATVQDAAPPSVSRADTLGNMRVLDEVRRQIGLGF
ncbi:MAG: Gfo/Idh/MocA family oxidoreductase [Phycisphaeraceae bacterium]|nr:Gfo/Idh/MocA family oxidoreductase [Phycisphaeraceae bacterium]